jgi:hypothetical protein
MFQVKKISKIIKINKQMRILASLKFGASKNIKIVHETSLKKIKVLKSVL